MGDLATPTPKHHWANADERPTVKQMPKGPAQDSVVVSVVDDDECWANDEDRWVRVYVSAPLSPITPLVTAFGARAHPAHG